MDERRVESLVQLAHRIAQRRDHLASQGHRGIAAIHRLGKRLAPHVLHDHDAALAHGVAFQDGGQVQKPPPRALGFPNALVCGAQPFAFQVLAHVGPLFGAVRTHEVHALGGFGGAALEHGVNPVAPVAGKGVKMFSKFVGHDGIW